MVRIPPASKGTLNFQGNGIEEAPEGKSVNVVGLFSCGSNSGNFAGSGKDENVNFLEYRMMPVLDSGNGEAYNPYIEQPGSGYWYVTEDAKDPAFCVYMGDYFYKRENVHQRFVSVRKKLTGRMIRNTAPTGMNSTPSCSNSLLIRVLSS